MLSILAIYKITLCQIAFVIFLPKKVQNWAQNKINPPKIAKTFKTLSRWLNFAKSGHTVSELLSFALFDPSLFSTETL